MTEHIAAEIESEEPQEERLTTEFHIDVEWYETQGRSLATFARSRMCATCRQQAEEEATAQAEQPRRSSREKKPSVSGDDPFAVISKHCGQQPGYVTPGMPLMEAVFRLLLASGNRPATADDIIEELRQHETYGHYWPTLTPESLERMLRQDDYYGFRPLPTEE